MSAFSFPSDQLFEAKLSRFLSVHDVVGLPGCASVQQSTSEMKSSETFLPNFSQDGIFSGFGRAAAEG